MNNTCPFETHIERPPIGFNCSGASGTRSTSRPTPVWRGLRSQKKTEPTLPHDKRVPRRQARVLQEVSSDEIMKSGESDLFERLFLLQRLRRVNDSIS
jgi:hypothetical protein